MSLADWFKRLFRKEPSSTPLPPGYAAAMLERQLERTKGRPPANFSPLFLMLEGMTNNPEDKKVFGDMAAYAKELEQPIPAAPHADPKNAPRIPSVDEIADMRRKLSEVKEICGLTELNSEIEHASPEFWTEVYQEAQRILEEEEEEGSDRSAKPG